MSVTSAPPAPPGENLKAPTPAMKGRNRPRFRGAALFMAPSLILTFVFVYGFIAFSGWISLSNWKRPTRQGLTLRDPSAPPIGKCSKSSGGRRQCATSSSSRCCS